MKIWKLWFDKVTGGYIGLNHWKSYLPKITKEKEFYLWWPALATSIFMNKRDWRCHWRGLKITYA